MMREEEALAVLVASGAASEEEQAAFEAAAAADPSLRDDLAFWRSVATAARALDAEQADDAAAPGEAGWARLERALAADGDAARTAAPGEPASLAAHRRKRQQAAEDGEPRAAPTKTAAYWRPIAIAACLLLALQTSLSLFQNGSIGPQTPPPGSLIPAAGGQEAADAQGLRVAFRGGAPEAALRSLLIDAGARIVDGPSALGLYTLAFETRAARDAALAVFAAHPDLIESADPIDP